MYASEKVEKVVIVEATLTVSGLHLPFAGGPSLRRRRGCHLASVPDLQLELLTFASSFSSSSLTCHSSLLTPKHTHTMSDNGSQDGDRKPKPEG